MKKAITVLLSAVLLVCIFGACAKSDDIIGDKKLKPTESVNIEDRLEEDEFIGTYANEDYTMTVEQGENGMLKVVVKTPVKDRVSYEWQFGGYFSRETYRINYTQGVKTVISYDKDGNETGRETEYDDGVGRVQFSDSKALQWNSSLDDVSVKLERK